MTTEGSIHYAQCNGTCIIRFEGAIRYTLGHALDTFLDRLFERGDFDDVVIDLNGAQSIDSTGLGLLAKTSNLLRQRRGRKPLLFSTSPDINEVLTSMCLDEVFVLCDRIPDGAAGEPLPLTDPSAAELARTIADAHRLLCDMNDRNRAMFQSVVDAFEMDLRGT